MTLLMDGWTAVFQTPQSGTWRRDDGIQLVMRTDSDGTHHAIVSQNGQMLGRAVVRHRPDPLTPTDTHMLVPASTDPDVCAAAVLFWPRRPSLHYVVLHLAARLWPKEPTS